MLDASVRYAVLTAVGVLLLFAVPTEALGATPAWTIAGRSGPTHANLVGIAVIMAAWIYFMIVVGIRAAGGSDPVCWVALFVAVGAIAGFGVASLFGFDSLALVLLAVGFAAQLALSLRLTKHVRARRAATGAAHRLR